MKNQCETNDTCCSTEHGGGDCCSGSQSESCGSSSGCCGGAGDPIEKALHSWIGAFFAAKHQVQTEMLKSRIQKAWGPRMEKAADAVLETVEAMFTASLSKSEAAGKLKERLRSLFQEGHK